MAQALTPITLPLTQAPILELLIILYENGIGKTTLTTFRNDANGFSIYAIGFTNDLYEGEPHTKLVGQNTNQTISTKVYASGDTASNWSMKLTKVDNPVSGDPVTYNPNNMTVTNSFNNWHVVPDTYTKVAEYHSSTSNTMVALVTSLTSSRPIKHMMGRIMTSKALLKEHIRLMVPTLP